MVIMATNIGEYKLYTKAEIAYIRQESYAGGCDEGYRNGYEEGYNAGFDSGSTPIGLTPEGE